MSDRYYDHYQNPDALKPPKMDKRARERERQAQNKSLHQRLRRIERLLLALVKESRGRK